MWIQEKEVITLKTTKDISFPQARRLVEETDGPLTYAKVASYPKPTLRDSPKKKIQLDGMKSISKTSHTTLGSKTPTEIQSDNRPEDSDNMATEENSLGKEDKNPQESHEMASEEELSSGDDKDDENSSENHDDSANTDSDHDREDPPIDEANFFQQNTLEQILTDLLQDKIEASKFPSNFRNVIKDRFLQPACTLLDNDNLRLAKKLLTERSKMKAENLPKEMFTSKHDILRTIGPYRFTDDEYGILLLLVLHNLLSVAKKVAKKHRKLTKNTTYYSQHGN